VPIKIRGPPPPLPRPRPLCPCPSTPMALRSPLGHFSFGMSAISLTIILILLIVTQIAVFRDTWGGDDRPVSNATGVSLFTCIAKSC